MTVALAAAAEGATASGGTATYWITTAIFVVAFAAILSERIHKTVAALFGAGLMLVLEVVTQHEAFHTVEFGVDYNVVFLLISMMIIVGIVARSGLFEWVAVRSAKLAGGRPVAVMALYVALTAVASAFLDNVTTVLLLAPVTLLIAEELDVDPVPFLIVEALASNIGGTATLIGDPPNIMIASRAELTFLDFLVHLAPAVLVMLAAMLVVVWLLFRNRLQVSEERRRRVLAMDESRLIADRRLAAQSIVVLGLSMVAFALHGVLHLEPATIAWMAAATLLLVSRQDVHAVLAGIEWSTVFFFLGLFVMVGGLRKVGVIHDVSHVVIELTEPSADDMTRTASTLLWFSGVASAVVDNIPYVATMTPLVLDMANQVFHEGAADAVELPAATLHAPALMPVWWALALGSCLGGNGTPIGASANVIVIGVAERSGVVITFRRFLAYGVPTLVLTLAISHIYLWLRYF